VELNPAELRGLAVGGVRCAFTIGRRTGADSTSSDVGDDVVDSVDGRRAGGNTGATQCEQYQCVCVCVGGGGGGGGGI
jgi:hypothetical protein